MKNETNKTLTAVEWLENEIDNLLELYHSEQIAINTLLSQAKEMEKQQMIDFANDLLAQQDSNYIAKPDLANQYYEQTYGGDK